MIPAEQPIPWWPSSIDLLCDPRNHRLVAHSIDNFTQSRLPKAQQRERAVIPPYRWIDEPIDESVRRVEHPRKPPTFHFTCFRGQAESHRDRRHCFPGDAPRTTTR